MANHPRLFSSLVLLLVSLLAACGSGDGTLADVDPNAVPLDPDFQLIVNILDRACVPCHEQGSNDEDPEDSSGSTAASPGTTAFKTFPDLETCQSIVDNQAIIVDRALDKNDMPPGAWPRLSSEERLIILRWIANGAKAPCN